MIPPRRLLRRFKALVFRRALAREIDEEMRLHVELEAAQLERDGLAPEEARATAVRAFGRAEHYGDRVRDVRGLFLLDDLERDVRFGVRGLLRQPALTVTAALTLAIGIGGTTAIYTAVRGVLLAPLPYRDAERVITLWQRDRLRGGENDQVAPANFLDWRERSRSFEYLAAAEPYSFDWIGPDGPERFENSNVSLGFFEALGVRPLLGRTFLPEEFQPGRENVVILSHALWRGRFGGDPALVGRTLVLDSVPRTVVGVMPPGVDLPFGQQIWAPKIFREDERESRTSAYYTVVGRLRPDVTLESARAELSAIAAQLTAEHPTTNASTGTALVPLPEQLLGGVRGALLVLLGAVGFVLLIACANVANLLLARAVRRQREFALRTALGAGGGRLARQLLTESVLLALIGGAAGAALAVAGVAAIKALAPVELPRVEQLRVDGAVLLFALALSLGTALLFGFAPVVHVVRGDLRGALGGSERTTTAGRTRGRLRGALVVAELALALVLVVGAGLLLRSFATLSRVERGFRSDGVVVVTLQAWGYYPTPERRAGYVREATARLAALPGVRAVGTTSSLPLTAPIGAERTSLDVDGRPDARPEERPAVFAAATTPGYFAALRVPLRAGRLYTSADDETAPPVAVVNETLARRLWPGESPLGERIVLRFAGRLLTREVVGVVGDVRHDGLHEAPRASVFLPHAQAPSGALHFVVRVTGGPAAALPAIRRELQSLNGAMPLTDATTLDRLVAESLRERRFHLSLLATFAGVALLLAAVGIYGVMSHSVSERTHELGVRVALGARASDVLGLVLRRGAGLAIAGVAIGVAGAAAVTRLLRGLLFEITPLDPATFASGVAALVAVAMLACWLPARRATRLDPVRALRAD